MEKPSLGTIKKIGNVVSNLLLGETKEMIIRTDESVRHIETDIDEIKNDCKMIWSNLTDCGLDIQGLKVHTQYGHSNSPTVPSEKGKKLLQDSKFDEVYPKFKKEIFDLMDSWKLRTLYDFEIGAEKALNNLKDNPVMDPLKNHSVNNPKESLELIFKVASWIIRDDYVKYREGK